MCKSRLLARARETKLSPLSTVRKRKGFLRLSPPTPPRKSMCRYSTMRERQPPTRVHASTRGVRVSRSAEFRTLLQFTKRPRNSSAGIFHKRWRGGRRRGEEGREGTAAELGCRCETSDYEDTVCWSVAYFGDCCSSRSRRLSGSEMWSGGRTLRETEKRSPVDAFSLEN